MFIIGPPKPRAENSNKTFIITKGMKIFHIYKDYSNREPTSQKTAYFNPYNSRNYNSYGNEQITNSNSFIRPFNVLSSNLVNESNLNLNNTYGSFTVINSNFTPFNNQMIKEEGNMHSNLNNYNRMSDVNHLIKKEELYEKDELDSQMDGEYDESYKNEGNIGNMYQILKVNSDAQEHNNIENYNQNRDENNDEILNEENNEDNFENVSPQEVDEIDDYEGEGNYISRYDRFS